MFPPDKSVHHSVLLLQAKIDIWMPEDAPSGEVVC